MGVRSYPIVERDSLVWIWMGEADKADESLIVDFPYLREPGWRGVPDYLHYDANYLLIVDNLADFAHLAFVHRHTLGGSEEYAFKTKPVEVERQPRGFRVKRMHMNAEVPPFHRKVTRNSERIDRWNVGTMHVPGVFFLESGFAPAGSGIERGDISQAKQYRNCQFFTPETARTTHFFWNYLHNWSLDDSTIALSLHDSMVEGFHADKAIIEQQQKTIDADPDFRMHPIAAVRTFAACSRRCVRGSEAPRWRPERDARQHLRADARQRGGRRMQAPARAAGLRVYIASRLP
jgi:vanillate O-demethylase monooxygenase subunit